MSLNKFIGESLRIEGIYRDPTNAEIAEAERFMELEKVTIQELQKFISVYEPCAVLRDQKGLDVRVGDYVAPRGGADIIIKLNIILSEDYPPSLLRNQEAYKTHQRYEALHPFTDCNGRSGRMLWLWQMGHVPSAGFLHTWYYQSLKYNR